MNRLSRRTLFSILPLVGISTLGSTSVGWCGTEAMNEADNSDSPQEVAAEYRLASGAIISFLANGRMRWTVTDVSGGLHGGITPGSAFRLETTDGERKNCKQVNKVDQANGTAELNLDFGDGWIASLQVTAHEDFLLFEAIRAEPVDRIASITWLRVAAPEGASLYETLNAVECDTIRLADGEQRSEGENSGSPLWIAIMAGEPKVQATAKQSGVQYADREGCSHRFEPLLFPELSNTTTDMISNTSLDTTNLPSNGSNALLSGEQTPPVPPQRCAARFTATCDEKPSGWSTRGKAFEQVKDWQGLCGVRLRVRGDGKGEQLKIQFADTAGACRDYYIPIDFEGWRVVTIHETSYDKINPQRVARMNLYYNGIPAQSTVCCDIDWIGILLSHDPATDQVKETEINPKDTAPTNAASAEMNDTTNLGHEEFRLIEDFESDAEAWWSDAVITPEVTTFARYGGVVPAKFGLILSPKARGFDAIRRFELAAEMPVSYFEGVWNKTSPLTKRSYLFLTSFGAAQYDEALAMAKRGGFRTILLGQESWCESTGHYGVNRAHFPGGLPQLQEILRRFRTEGFLVGFHFLAASIYPPDSYLTPVPDRRLVKQGHAELAAEINETTDFIPVTVAPTEFPAEDGGYMGKGLVLQIEDELITYQRLVTEPDVNHSGQVGFAGCTRGHLGTAAAPHRPGARVDHLLRSYGYHMYDMDTTLFEEVTENFAQIANACDIDMIYYDGSEALQGEHWYYNAKLHDTFARKLRRRDVFMQASSHSHYSWHLLARSASADGHDDLKAYLDERSPAFPGMLNGKMPLDIGWYYGYDPNCSLDMYEYVLGATIGYDSSMSFQTSVDAAKNHPYTNEILDLIGIYEHLRLSGAVDEPMRERLRIDPRLGGYKTDEERVSLSLRYRRDYRLIRTGEMQTPTQFQRVIYLPWQTTELPANITEGWTFSIPELSDYASQSDAAREMAIGARIHVNHADPQISDPGLVRPRIRIERMDSITPAPTVSTFMTESRVFEYDGVVAPGQYLIFRPGEPTMLYGKPLEHAQMTPSNTEILRLSPGTYRAWVDADEVRGISLRAGITLEPMESWSIAMSKTE